MVQLTNLVSASHKMHCLSITNTKLLILFSLRNTFFFVGDSGPTLVMVFSFMRFLDHTRRRIRVGRIPPDE